MLAQNTLSSCEGKKMSLEKMKFGAAVEVNNCL